jgi:hypothetical protein
MKTRKIFNVLTIVLSVMFIYGCSSLEEYRIKKVQQREKRLYSIFLSTKMDEVCAREFAFKGKSSYGSCYQYRYTPEVVKQIDELRKQVEGLSQEQIDKATDGHLSIGMSAEQVKLSLGRPDDVNNTFTKNSVHSQWVYRIGQGSTTYVYFENRKVTAWQDY